ncbi:kinesin-like protein KIF27 [Lampris incognitus]|uniref:kinesin-like protein KIF27 n=1 Tax=Lampris incognitus TaxID=2546036 RepID=UPI0024B61A3B|nr:kinesin-like protein KIF27 [Lampris incognitus]
MSDGIDNAIFLAALFSELTTVVVGAKETVVTSAEELLSILEAGNALRHTGTTGMNVRSSRSHAILTIQLTQRCHDSSSSINSVRSSKLHLVDLAGSERAGKTGNTGMRLKESVHINTGLLALSNVIRALSDPGRNRRGNSSNSNHVPYRDAKITRLLRDSLGGTAHTLMVACVSPSHHSVAETLSVLQFACRARHIRNRPKAMCPNSDVKPFPISWDPSEARLGELEFEIQTLREMLINKETELQREREKVGGHTGQDADRSRQTNESDMICDPERMVNQQDLSEYCLLAQEAAELLKVTCSPTLSPSLRQRMEDWQETLTAVNHAHQTDDKYYLQVNGEQPHHVTILQLRREFNKCQEARVIDQKVLEQKEEELRQVQEKFKKLLQESETHFQALKEEKQCTRIQTEQLVDQQILIDRLRSNLKTSRVPITGASAQIGASQNSAVRLHGTPVIGHSCGHGPARKIHTSPPAYSLERVIAAFKTRGQLLLAEIEEKEEVYCPFIKHQEKKDTDQGEGKEDDDEDYEDNKKTLRRSLNHTWTSQQRKMAQKQNNVRLDQNSKNGILLQQPHLTTGAGEHHGKQHGLKNSGLRTNATQRRIQELSINMRMKEELIKELEKTARKAQAVDSCVRHSGNGTEVGVLVRLSLQSQQTQDELKLSLQHMNMQRVNLLRQERETSSTSKEEPDRIRDLTVHQREFYDSAKEKEYGNGWLEAEEEQALQRRTGLLALEEELRVKEEVLQRREVCVQQRNTLAIQRLRSSQALTQDLLRVSARLGSLEEQLEGRKARQTGGVTKEEMEKEREALRWRRDALDAQLKEGRVLTTQEEHCLLQLEEAIEALDAAVEFKNCAIQDKQRQLSIPPSSSCHLHNTEPVHLCDVTRKLQELSMPEGSQLLVKYFNKVVCLREEQRRLQLFCDDLQLQTEEQEGVVGEMEAALQRLALDADRRLTEQHQKHQNSIQLLLEQFKEGAPGETEQAAQARLQQLEKDLFFYKSSNRQLKKKLKELLSDHVPPPQQPAAQPSHKQAQSLHKYTKANSHPHTEQIRTKTHSEHTHTMTHNHQPKISHVQVHNEHTLPERHPDQPSCPSSFSDLQTHKIINIPPHTQICTHSQSQVMNVQGHCHSVEGLEMTPVRLSRRELRPFSPAGLQVSESATRGHHSEVETSIESLLEDSIEMS